MFCRPAAAPLFISFPPFCATELAAEFNVSDVMILHALASTRVAVLNLEVIVKRFYLSHQPHVLFMMPFLQQSPSDHNPAAAADVRLSCVCEHDDMMEMYVCVLTSHRISRNAAAAAAADAAGCAVL